jgi:hypothetical protein
MWGKILKIRRKTQPLFTQLLLKLAASGTQVLCKCSMPKIHFMWRGGGGISARVRLTVFFPQEFSAMWFCRTLPHIFCWTRYRCIRSGNCKTWANLWAYNVCVFFVYNLCSKRFLAPSNVCRVMFEMLSETHVRLQLEVCFILNKIKMCRDNLKFTKIK